MIYIITDYLSVDDGITGNEFFDDLNTDNLLIKCKSYDDNMRICINNVWYDVIPTHELVRFKSEDGYIRAIYIWINYDSFEYYIGKVNAANKRKLLNYSGSGVKFKLKYNKHKDRFARYYIYYCKRAKETEKVESEIVNQELLKDPFCLNLVQGGGGVSNAPQPEERKAKQSQYMKDHPEKYQAMLDDARSFDKKKIEERNNAIRKTMSGDEYKNMSSERIKNWRKNNPEGYKKARKNNKAAMSSEESKKKRNESLAKWRKEHQKEYALQEENRRKALGKKETREKISNSQKDWIKNNPEAAKERNMKMHAALKELVCIPIEMYDVTTKETISSFNSLKEAGDWLVLNGYTKSKNPSSSISAVCLRKEGHYSYLGFGWRYKEK